MVTSKDFRQLGPYLYEVPQSYREDMRVPARFYSDGVLLEAIKSDKSLTQLVNTATMPGIAPETRSASSPSPCPIFTRDMVFPSEESLPQNCQMASFLLAAWDMILTAVSDC